MYSIYKYGDSILFRYTDERDLTHNVYCYKSAILDGRSNYVTIEEVATDLPFYAVEASIADVIKARLNGLITDELFERIMSFNPE